jgi:hypothetical protein
MAVSIDALREHIRRLIAVGELPRQGAIHVDTVEGSGAPCQACGDVVPRADSEHRLRFIDRSWRPYTVRLHSLCRAIWEIERRRAA